MRKIGVITGCAIYAGGFTASGNSELDTATVSIGSGALVFKNGRTTRLWPSSCSLSEARGQLVGKRVRAYALLNSDSLGTQCDDGAAFSLPLLCDFRTDDADTGVYDNGLIVFGVATIQQATNAPALRESAPAWPWGDHETDLLRHLAEAGRQWWSTYDAGQPSTAPTNEQVTQWLKKRRVPSRTAEVMATILRANGLPRGPRK